MDLPLTELLSLIKVEPGSDLAQTILLFLIWVNSRSLKKELVLLKEALTRLEISHEVRIVNLENENKIFDQRLTLIEKH